MPTPDSPCTDWQWWMRWRAHCRAIHLLIGVLEQELGCIWNACAWERDWSRELRMRSALAHVDHCAHRCHWRQQGTTASQLVISLHVLSRCHPAPWPWHSPSLQGKLLVSKSVQVSWSPSAAQSRCVTNWMYVSITHSPPWACLT